MNTITKLLLVWLLSLVVVLTMGCNEKSSSGTDSSKADVDGGPCEYNDIQGTATINAVVEPNDNEDNCKNAVKIIFTFIPDDIAAPGDYRFGEWSDQDQQFTVGAGKNPTKTWSESVGLFQGSTHKCVRSEIINGTCTPVIFSFPEIDLTGWEKKCF